MSETPTIATKPEAAAALTRHDLVYMAVQSTGQSYHTTTDCPHLQQNDPVAVVEVVEPDHDAIRACEHCQRRIEGAATVLYSSWEPRGSDTYHLDAECYRLQRGDGVRERQLRRGDEPCSNCAAGKLVAGVAVIAASSDGRYHNDPDCRRLNVVSEAERRPPTVDETMCQSCSGTTALTDTSFIPDSVTGGAAADD